ncbi:hypothetical protein KFK09_016313 [Dendrobium nobile]|uniref:Uncharacterized protein n=1 Tax=Dendrobium nobile TaxID=94219 RepID=A0A8T3AZK5_DENNO|nr:hypothetical protein KFK09_016313 [Dendrobium nobile]
MNLEDWSPQTWQKWPKYSQRQRVADHPSIVLGCQILLRNNTPKGVAISGSFSLGSRQRSMSTANNFTDEEGG